MTTLAYSLVNPKLINKKWFNYISVPFRLRSINILFFLSGIVSIAGAYEIQEAGKMHNFNYLHQKYIYQLSMQISEDERKNIISVDAIRNRILMVREQPIDCLTKMQGFRSIVITWIGTQELLEICSQDLTIANASLDLLADYEAGMASKSQIYAEIKNALDIFIRHGEEFEPLVADTVGSIFLIVFIIVIIKAAFVPALGMLISSGVAHDYKELSATRHRLVQEQERREVIQSERMTALSTMVAGIAHEINTPLGIGVTANSHMGEMLKKTKTAYEAGTLSEEDLTDYFDDMSSSCAILDSNLERTASLVRSFKQVSADQTSDETRMVDVRSYIQDVLTSLNPVTRKSLVTIDLECPHNLSMRFNPGAISQILTNLVTNALVHAFDPGEAGTITIMAREHPSDMLSLKVADDGKGVPQAIQNTLFDPFVTTRRGKGGTGLGLHMVHNLVVEKLGGQIRCDARPCGGTVFSIEIPAQAARHI